MFGWAETSIRSTKQMKCQAALNTFLPTTRRFSKSLSSLTLYRLRGLQNFQLALFHSLHIHAVCSTPIVGLGLVPPTRCATMQDCKPQSALFPWPTGSPYQQCVLLQPTNQLTALFICNTKCTACRSQQYNSRYKY